MARPWPVVAACVACVAVTATGIAVAADAAEARPKAPAATAPSADTADTAATATTLPAAVQDATVRPLRRLTTPDAVVRLLHPASDRQLQRLRNRPGVRAVAVVDRGTVRVAGRRLRALGVDPSEIRGFTPSLTAQSDALWQSVARGDLTLSYGDAGGLRRHLGGTLTVLGRRGSRQPARLGALAAFGLGRAEAVVDHSDAQLLGLATAREIYVAAPRRSRSWISATLTRVLGASAHVHSLRPPKPQRPVMSDYARATIPADYLARYQLAASTCPGLPWTVLAGIGAVETWHGSNVHRSSKGAVGPMQFLPSTFATYGVDGDGDGVADVQDPDDAIYSAARYLCLWGAGRGGQALYDAVFAYNHADWYVRRVFAFANAYV